MVEFASEPRTARSSPDWTAQHRCDSTQNWCPQSRVVALWAATLPTPWRMLPSALSCRVQTWAPQPSCPVPRQPLGRSGRLFAVPAVHGPPRFEQASPSAALALCPSAAPPGAAERGGGRCGRPEALCLPLEELLHFRQTLAFPGSLESPSVQGRPRCLPPWLQELSVS